MGVGDDAAVSVGVVVAVAVAVAVGTGVAGGESVAAGAPGVADGEGASGIPLPDTLQPTRVITTHIAMHPYVMLLSLGFTVDFLHTLYGCKTV